MYHPGGMHKVTCRCLCSTHLIVVYLVFPKPIRASLDVIIDPFRAAAPALREKHLKLERVIFRVGKKYPMARKKMRTLHAIIRVVLHPQTPRFVDP